MAIDYTALATEINTDPSTLGYAASVTQKNDQAVADILNLARAGAAFTANREPVSVALLFASIDSTEFLALTAVKSQQLLCVLTAGAIDLNDASTQAILIGIFGNPSTTRTNLIALRSRQGSRAEKLFGRGTVITANDISRALRGA